MKVAIIGAGITGLYLAWKLAERGENVTVFEKREKIGKEACSGLFSDRILEFIPQSKNLIQNKIDYTLIRFPKKTLRIEFSRPFFVMSHSELDKLAADLVEEKGAKLVFGHSERVTGTVDEASLHLHLRPAKRDLVFDRVIGCDGALSQTRKDLGLAEPEFYSGIQGTCPEERSDERVDSNYVETWPTKSGFIWKIPRSGETEYGIMEKPKIAKAVFSQFLRKNNLNLEGIRSALIPQGLIVSQDPIITLCGDAAGLTKPWSGGGVIWGLTAADLLLKNFPDFIRYQKELKSLFLPKIIISKLAKSLVYFLGFYLPWALPKNYQIESDFLI